MTGVLLADLFVGWIGDKAAHVARYNRMDALKLLIDGLHAPEASCPQRDSFRAFWNGFGVCREFFHLRFREVAGLLAATILAGCRADEEHAEECRDRNWFHGFGR